ncbi:Protein of unknown function [Pyronema omphalodes CBS 100304]|uniref:Uncharacterized protein n=1 Tax=Pyronema omphalodes (strain CBS 100304) TaxID=1076935 RepID=U4L4F4_PYROM|nr:Protein of unknown function [Pyronema omphalodes CBS 100304]
MEQPETDETREAAEILVDNMINIMYENPNWDSNGTKCFDWDECITAFYTFRICAEKFLLHETAYKEVPRNTREALLQCCIILLDEKNIFRNLCDANKIRQLEPCQRIA